MTLTTKSWLEGLIDVPEESWIRGGTPSESRIVPWSVQSIGREEIEFWQGRLENSLVDEAVTALVGELRT